MERKLKKEQKRREKDAARIAEEERSRGMKDEELMKYKEGVFRSWV